MDDRKRTLYVSACKDCPFHAPSEGGAQCALAVAIAGGPSSLTYTMGDDHPWWCPLRTDRYEVALSYDQPRQTNIIINLPDKIVTGI